MTQYWASPKWTAATAYLVGAVITPATPNGTVWRCTTAGTSGIAEPTWATASPWTTADGTGTLVWSLGTSFRQNVNAGLYTILAAFATANPSILRAVYTERPQSFSMGELPCVYVDSQAESYSVMNGIRTRTETPVVILVDKSPAPEEMSDRQNFLVDALVDLFTANVHAPGGNTILGGNVVTIAESDESDGPTHYSVISFNLGETLVIEGRT